MSIGDGMTSNGGVAGDACSQSVAVNVLSTFGAVFWSIQLIPQLWINWRRKSGDGLQPSMMIAWALAGVPLGIHNILGAQPVALQVQAQILTSLSLATWAQVMYYDHRWSMFKCLTLLGMLGSFFAGVEAAFIFGFRSSSHEAVKQKAVLAMAILAALGLSFGVLRHYYDIYVHRTVRGIAWGFVLLDAAGDLTSLLSVTICSPPDVRSAAIYASELALWIGIMIAGLAFNARHWITWRMRAGNAQSQRNDEQHRPTQTEVSDDAAANADLQRTNSIQSVSSAFSRVIPDAARRNEGNWMLRRLRRPPS